MDGDGARLLVLSADDACGERVERVCRHAGYPLPDRINDPTKLQGALSPDEGPDKGPRRERVGVVVDLTTPVPGTGAGAAGAPAIEADQAAKLAWCVATLGPALSASPAPSLLLVTTNAHVGEALRHYGLAVAAQVAPDAGEAAWRHALGRLLASLTDPDGEPRERPHRHAAPLPHALPPTALRLRPDLWLDLDGAALQDADGNLTPLTRQEVALLAVLADSPGCFHSTTDLACRLARPSAVEELDRHSVGQTVGGLRRKLGETARGARLLRTQYGMGYGLFPEPE